jgi:hypothetical protein
MFLFSQVNNASGRLNSPQAGGDWLVTEKHSILIQMMLGGKINGQIDLLSLIKCEWSESDHHCLLPVW